MIRPSSSPLPVRPVRIPRPFRRPAPGRSPRTGAAAERAHARILASALWLASLLAATSSLAPGTGRAHELRPAVADLSRDGDTLGIELRVNVEALLAGIGVEHEDTDDSPRAADYDALRALDPDALRQRLDAFLPELLDGLTLVDEDGTRLDVEPRRAEIPETGDVRVARDSTLELSAPSPPAGTSITWGWREAYGPIIVRSARADGPDAFSVYLLAGETSDPLPIGTPDDPPSPPDATDPRDAGTDASAARRPPLAGTFANYVRVGFVHIVPLGLDHILFVIGLFLLAPRARPILWQVTAFTLAHSITLALATLGLVSVPSRIVEPLIALSIVAVCVENLLTARLHRWRLAIVFGFGLLHGLGFASVLRDVGGDASAFLTTLVAFNVGVELGQLLVVALCFALVGWWFRDRPWYRRAITVPGSLAVGAVGLFWFVQRTLG